MNSSVDVATFGGADLAAASGIGLALIGITAVVYSFSGLSPGFALPLAVALVASCIDRFLDYRKGKRSVKDLEKLDKNFVGWAISSAVFGLVMPMLFPSGAYEYARWLVYFNTVFLVAGLAGVPVAKGFAFMVILIARKRTSQKNGDTKS